MSEELAELPEGWEWRQINELCAFNPKHNKEAFDDLEISFVPMAAVDEKTGAIYKHDRKLLGEVRKGYTHFADGDVIFAKITPCMENGKSAVARDLCNGLACGSTEFHVLRSCDAVLPEYLHNFLRQEIYLHDAAGAMTGVVGQRRLPKEFLLGTKLPLPPLNEQRRIVAKIEALRARSQRAKEALEAIRPLLDQFRQSVLAAAFRGDLTADWREQNPDVEPASVLLERIRSNHKRCQEKHRLIDLPDPSVLPEIPSKWLWVTVEHLGAYEQQTVLTGPFGATLGREDFLEDGVPVITIGCLQSRGLDLSKAMYISQKKADELERYKLKAGDFLFSRMASVGRAAIVEDLSGAIFNYHLMRLRLSRELIEAKYFLYYVRGASAVFQYVKDVNHGATRDGINTQQLSKMPVALPPFEEQRQIVQIIENYFNRTHSIDDFVSSNLEELQAFNQSILAKAFRGELVPQDSNDEPASILLEHIRAERARKEAEAKAAKTTGKTRGRRKIDEVDLSEQISLPGLE